MSSALAAFDKAQTQQAPPEVQDEDQEDDETYASDLDHATPSPLAGFAQPQQPQEMNSSRKALTLVEVAKSQQPSPHFLKPTLLDVARDRDQITTSNQLHAIALDVQQEDRDAAQRRAREIDRQLLATSQQVQQEQQAQRHQQVKAALREATLEEPAYDLQNDPFETDDDPVVARAAERVVHGTTAKASKTNGTSLSVDRHVLKQRARRPGLASKSTTKAKTMKDTLSPFQFGQLSLAQQRVFLAMLVEDKKGSSKKGCNKHAMEELAKDRATQLREKQRLLKIKPPKYAKFEDARHCRFMPKIKTMGGGASRDRDDDDDDEDGGGGGNAQRREDFIRRMEATERVRMEQLRRTRAERDYLAQIDKKECPQCGNPQSYAELSQKRKKCPNCGVPYKSRLAWGQIADEFLTRMASHLETRLVVSTADNQQDESSGFSNPKTRWCDVRDEFLGRVQLDLQQRELTKELLLHELEAQCTFAPQITDRAKRLRLAGDFDERLRRDLETRRLRQQQYRVLSAAIAEAETATSKSQQAIKPLPRSFEERLRKDLEKRRERLDTNHRNAGGAGGRSRGLY